MVNLPKAPTNWVCRPSQGDPHIFHSVCECDEYQVAPFLKGATVLDLGAHIGSFSYLAAKLGAAKVLAYESHPHNFEILALNMRPFVQQVVCVPTAVVGAGEPITSSMETFAHKLHWSWPSLGGGEFDVCCDYFDDVVESLGRVDVLKMDIEGSEFPILRSTKQLHKIGRIAGEYHNGYGGADRHCDELEAILKAAGFHTLFKPPTKAGNPWGGFSAWKV